MESGRSAQNRSAGLPQAIVGTVLLNGDGDGDAREASRSSAVQPRGHGRLTASYGSYSGCVGLGSRWHGSGEPRSVAAKAGRSALRRVSGGLDRDTTERYGDVLGVVRSVDVVGGMLPAGVVFEGVSEVAQPGVAFVDDL